MFGNWCKETTTTTGTGTLTLSAVSGFPRISQAFPVGERVSYALLNSSGEPIECGIGTVGASNTLERTIPRWTFSGGTLTLANAAAISLSGTITVIAAAIAGSFAPTLPAVSSAASQRLIGSNHQSASGADAKALGNTNTVFYVPFLLEAGCDVDAFVINVTSQGAGNVRIGLYNVGANGLPGNKIIESADVSVATTGVKTGTFTRRYLPPGWYYIAIASKAIAVSVRSYTAAGMLRSGPFGWNSFDGQIIFATETLSGGWTDLPATASGSLSYTQEGGDWAPRVVFRAA